MLQFSRPSKGSGHLVTSPLSMKKSPHLGESTSFNHTPSQSSHSSEEEEEPHHAASPQAKVVGRLIVVLVILLGFMLLIDLRGDAEESKAEGGSAHPAIYSPTPGTTNAAETVHTAGSGSSYYEHPLEAATETLTNEHHSDTSTSHGAVWVNAPLWSSPQAANSGAEEEKRGESPARIRDASRRLNHPTGAEDANGEGEIPQTRSKTVPRTVWLHVQSPETRASPHSSPSASRHTNRQSTDNAAFPSPLHHTSIASQPHTTAGLPDPNAISEATRRASAEAARLRRLARVRRYLEGRLPYLPTITPSTTASPLDLADASDSHAINCSEVIQQLNTKDNRRKLWQMLCPTNAEATKLQNSNLTDREMKIQAAMSRYEDVKANHTLRRLVLGAGANETTTRNKDGVRVRFLTTATSINDFLFRAVTGAIISGVPLEVLGLGWSNFTLPQRYELLLSYIAQEELHDDDVILMMDSDAVFLGEDPYRAIEAFVSLSPASETELTDVQGIRLGRRIAPLRFSTENYCMRRQAVSKSRCINDYDRIEQLMEAWAESEQIGYLTNKDGVQNVLRFLNSGFMIARVWALKRYIPAFRQYMAEHEPRGGGPWTSDQSVTSTLYLQLRWWEIVSGAIGNKVPRNVSEEMSWASGLSVTPVLTRAGYGPYGLPGGLIDLEDSGRFTAVLSKYALSDGVIKSMGTVITHVYKTENLYRRKRRAMRYQLRKKRMAAIQSTMIRSPTGVIELLPVVSFVTRPVVDCVSEAVNTPRCENRVAALAMLGIDPDEEIRPLSLHFAGYEKRHLTHFSHGDFPWALPTELLPYVRQRMEEVLWAAPATKTHFVKPFTEAEMEAKALPQLVPHNTTEDTTVFSLCTHFRNELEEEVRKERKIRLVCLGQ